MKQPETQLITPPKTDLKPIRLNKKKLMFMDLWTNPESKTFGNVYRSGLAAGFSPTYSRNIQNVAPKWFKSFIDRLQLEQEHIIAGVQHLATKPILNSRSPDDTRLNAYTQLGKWAGLEQSSSVTNIIVQPILGGQSVPQPPKQIIDIDPID